jgi:hypothetical protein
MNKKIIFVAAIFFALFLAACSTQTPQISLEFYEFAFGDVVNGTIVNKDIVIENDGGSPLIIEEVSTSCGCTTGTIEPGTISPGEKGVLHIEFDSGAHGPELTGLLKRQVFLETNDPASSEVMVEFTANVVLD